MADKLKNMHKIENTKPVADKAMEVANDPTAVVFFTFARHMNAIGTAESITTVSSICTLTRSLASATSVCIVFLTMPGSMTIP